MNASWAFRAPLGVRLRNIIMLNKINKLDPTNIALALVACLARELMPT